MNNEVAEIVAIRYVQIRRRLRPGREKQAAIGLEQVEGVRLRQVLEPSRRKSRVASVPMNVDQLVRCDDAETGDTRLHLLKDEIDHLQIAAGLLGEYDTEVCYRDPMLFDALRGAGPRSSHRNRSG